MLYLGIDPGMGGGAAAIDENCELFFEPRAFAKGTEQDMREILKEWMRISSIRVAMIEKVHSMPKQGVSSTFKFGDNNGWWRGLLVGLGIAHDFVTPQTWQKVLGCLSKGDKNVTKACAQRLYPGIKITHATADSILIARYCWLKHRVDPISA